MIKILFICDKHPCPPQNGLYVPVYELIQRLRFFSSVRLELCLPREDVGFESKPNSDLYFDKIHYLPLVSSSKWKQFLGLLCFRSPPYALNLFIPQNFQRYDLVFAVPDGFVTTLLHIKKRMLATLVVLWINEPYYTVSLGSLLNIKPYNTKGLVQLLKQYVKYKLTYYYEKAYLSRVDAVMVQTEDEANRFYALCGVRCNTRAFIFSNPIKQALLQRDIVHHAHVLLIHAPRSPSEIDFFVKQVSHYLQERQLDIVLRLCVHDTKLYGALFGEYPYVEIMGFQVNIVNVYQDVFCSVVFTKQRFGLVNRVKEGMTAGVAVLGYLEALRTVGPVENNVNVIYAKDEIHFVDRAFYVIQNRDWAIQLGSKARQFIQDNETHPPEQCIQELFMTIKKPMVDSNI